MKNRSKPKVHDLSDLSDGWDIAREANRPIKGSHDGRLYWFYPSGALRMIHSAPIVMDAENNEGDVPSPDGNTPSKSGIAVAFLVCLLLFSQPLPSSSAGLHTRTSLLEVEAGDSLCSHAMDRREAPRGNGWPRALDFLTVVTPCAVALIPFISLCHLKSNH